MKKQYFIVADFFDSNDFFNAHTREKWVSLGPGVHSPLKVYAYSIALTRNGAALHSLRQSSLLPPLSSPFTSWMV